MRKRLAGVVLCVVVAWVFLGDPLLARYRARPPEGVDDLRSFLNWRPEASEFRTTNVKGNDHLIAYSPSLGLFPSGPPAYVFDPFGGLVDWSADTGDDERFRRRWIEGGTPGKELDRQTAAKWPHGYDPDRDPVTGAPLERGASSGASVNPEAPGGDTPKVE